MPITSLAYLERKQYSERELQTLERALRDNADMFARWNQEGALKIRNPWRVGFEMFKATPSDLPGRDQLKTMLDKWYTRLLYQAPECWDQLGNVYDILDQIFDKYVVHAFRQEPWWDVMMSIRDDLQRQDLYT